MSAKIIEIRTRDGITNPMILDLLRKGFGSQPAIADPEGVIAWLADAIESEYVTALFGRHEGDFFSAFAIIDAEPSPFYEGATIPLLYAPDDSELRDAIVEAGVRWLVDRNIERLLIENASHLSDEAFISMLSPHLDGMVVRSVIELRPNHG